ncbi:AzlD domain-containing protein [Pullulanibacillus sp. KACC 23026]|uniref:AzlD domain-containing protein n=1 Tax=Pullulanibacillus sp. KACC 23026 TaxID=3028315 RepID=UPI0023B0A9CB|nr:AzlD domain-containing protein [Pullulanibacillus sp. KACC 23026]WEG12002.1 AzlD domain-containing protein [Pullulanibacillus sp. KACC 23026]
MAHNVMWIIVGMGLVTYIPRMLPLVAIQTDRIPPFVQAVLKNVPFAVLGALIFPGILVIQSGHLSGITMSDFLFGVLGGGVAFITAFLEWNIVFVVLSAIVVLMIYSIWF